MVTIPTLTGTDWTDADLESLRVALTTEQERRRIIRDAPALTDQIATQVLNATGRTKGLAWRQPQGGHDAYPQGWEVVHKGNKWTSNIPGNAYEPGVGTTWTKGEAATPAAAPAAAAWDGNAKAYAKGDRVSYKGKTYVVIQAHTSQAGWTPDVVASLYTAE